MHLYLEGVCHLQHHIRISSDGDEPLEFSTSDLGDVRQMEGEDSCSVSVIVLSSSLTWLTLMYM